MRYLIADVFTDTAFAGNQLGVVPQAEGLDTQQMQRIARELNFAETSFVTAGTAEGRFRTRIFTPATELPFAGHPTVGTAAVLAHLGRTGDASRIVLEENIGPVPVTLREGGATFAMQGAAETRPHGIMAVAFSDALGLKRTELEGEPWQAGYGLPFVLIRCKSRESVSRAKLHADRFEGLVPGLWEGRAVYVFAETAREGETMHVHARMFAPKLGVAEDPATGSAAAALAGSLVTDATRLLISQGVEMGRPSLIEAGIIRAEGAVSGITIGGNAVVVSEGRFLRLP